MRTPRCSLLAAAIAGAFAAIAGSAHALTCAGPGALAPAWDATDIPTNTLIWCTHWSDMAPFELQLNDAEGQPVSGTQTVLTGAGFPTEIFRPDTELAPHTRYSFHCPGYGEQPFSFTTGSGPRNEPPALPSLAGMSVRAQADGLWGESLLVGFESISAGGTIVVLDVEGGPVFEPSALAGEVDDLNLISLPEESRGSAFVGRAPCVGNWPGAQLGASTRVRFGAYDLTGAFSGWTDWKTVTLPDEFEKPAGTEPDAPTSPPTGAPDDGEVDEQTLTSNGDPINEVVGAELASDSAAAPSRQSSGCALGGPGGTWWAAALLAALGCIAVRRQHRGAGG